MKDQLKLVKDFGRRLERIEDIGCSYFKPRSARCRMQQELLSRLNKGQLHGIVKRDHLSQVSQSIQVCRSNRDTFEALARHPTKLSNFVEQFCCGTTVSIP